MEDADTVYAHDAFVFVEVEGVAKVSLRRCSVRSPHVDQYLI